jgi:hypothetical protein
MIPKVLPVLWRRTQGCSVIRPASGLAIAGADAINPTDVPNPTTAEVALQPRCRRDNLASPARAVYDFLRKYPLPARRSASKSLR